MSKGLAAESKELFNVGGLQPYIRNVKRHQQGMAKEYCKRGDFYYCSEGACFTEGIVKKDETFDKYLGQPRKAIDNNEAEKII